MNGLRRTLLAVYGLLLIAAAGGLIALTWNQDRKLDLNIGNFNLQAFVISTDSAKYGVTAVLAVVALVGLFSVIVAVMREGMSSSRSTLRLRQTDGGTVEVTASSIESLLRDELQQLPEVRSVNPRVRLGAQGAVETTLEATIEPSASIAQVTNDLGQAVANVLRTQVGVTNVKRPNVRITYTDLNARAMPPRQDPQRSYRTTGPSEFDSQPAGQRPQPFATDPQIREDPPSND